jgi:hypothetical protein
MKQEEQQFLDDLDKRLWDAAALGDQFKESAHLETEIRKNLAGLGYAILGAELRPLG